MFLNNNIKSWQENQNILESLQTNGIKITKLNEKNVKEVMALGKRHEGQSGFFHISSDIFSNDEDNKFKLIVSGEIDSRCYLAQLK